ncbi:mitochondrial ribonuclease P catalytic subunit [Spodoptera frugiperda]|uniref:Mitochondrial ribonuclease P catalytic subunit n=1 Tax=Spodoptera frugiperda TaxID=7108 RepID=A0A9R0D253_SPOFR|nr:mitochondrial ribonuclease P catalytic subunit [Spodoptera frugiperda]
MKVFNMFYSLTRIVTQRNNSFARVGLRLISQNASFVKEKNFDEQIEQIKSIDEHNLKDWATFKNDILSKQGNVNQKNIDAVILKYTTSLKKYDIALSFAQHLKSKEEELSLGTINSLLNLYYEISKKEKLTKDQIKFILDAHKSLYNKYKVLEYSTCERLLHALCAVNETDKALKVLSDIHLTTTPSHSAYSTLVATFFNLNKKKKALELIDESIKNKRPLLENAYGAWIDYVLRKYKDKNTIHKYLDEIYSFVAKNCAVIPLNTANKLKEVYDTLNWNAGFARIKKLDGQCSCCRDKLDCLTLTNDEFDKLQRIVKEKLIVGSDLFLKTSPEELKSFTDFVDKTAPYDIVLDGLNIAYGVGMASHTHKMKFLNQVVDHFVRQNKKILLLGRQHMMRWNMKMMQQIMQKTKCFFTENVSQDDPYFITAAILSGPHTDIVSKDLLRGHKFLLKDESLIQIFKRWQWQHQWMIFQNPQKRPSIQAPLKFTPCAQKKNNTWHLPYEQEASPVIAHVNDGIPDLYSWMCLRTNK